MHLALQEGIPIQVIHVIAAHSVEGANVERTIEASILYHADLMWYDGIIKPAKAPSKEP